MLCRVRGLRPRLPLRLPLVLNAARSPGQGKPSDFLGDDARLATTGAGLMENRRQAGPAVTAVTPSMRPRWPTTAGYLRSGKWAGSGWMVIRTWVTL